MIKTNKIFIVVAFISYVACIMACTNNTSTKKEKAIKKDSAIILSKLPTNSIYQLQGLWITQDNKIITLADLRGKIQVVAMVFTHCKYACPKIVSDIQAIEQHLPANIKSKVGFTLVSFDEVRDTVARLKEFAREMNLGSNWTLIHGNDQHIRELSMLLDVNYEKLENGDFNHTNVITVLDPNGVIIQRHEGLELNPEEMAQKIALSFK